MTRGRRLLLVLTVAAGCGAVGAIGWAYFSAPGSGTASAGVSTLDAPTDVTASAVGTTVDVSWTGVTAPDGSSTVAYWVQRYSGSTPTDACGSSHAAPIAPGTGPESCADTGVATGTYTYTVTAVFRSWTAASAASDSVTVSAAALDHFTVTAPSSATAGSAFDVTVAAKDELDNPFTGYVGTVHFSTSDPNAPNLPGDYTFVSGDNGTHTFSSAVTLKTAGAQTVSVNDTVETAKTGTSSSITVGGSTLDHFLVTAPASESVANAFTTATVTARDIYDNPASGWSSATKCVTFSGPGNAPLGTAPNYPAQGACAPGQSSLSFDATAHASGFGITLYKAETTALTVTASATTATSGSIVVTPGTAAGFLVEAPASATAGTPFTVTSLTARDAYNNVATAYTGSHTIAWSGPAASPNGTAPTFPATSVDFTSGVSTTALNATLVKAETTTLTASETAGPSGSASITVDHGSASNLVLAAATTTPAAGAADNLTITAKDGFGNVAISYAGDKSLTFSGAATIGVHNPTVSNKTGVATNFGTATTITFASGVSTVSGVNNGVMKLYKAETASIVVTDGAISNGAGLSVTVAAGGPASLSLGAATTTPTAGVANNLTITASALDAFGNTATSYTGDKVLTFGGASNAPNGTVPTVSSKTGGATNFGTATTITFTNGVATVSGANNGVMRLYKAESANITVTDGTINNGAGLSVTVSPAAASVAQLTNCIVNTVSVACTSPFSVGNSPGNVKANIRVTDAWGNTPAATTVSFTVTSANGNYTVSGSPVSITAGTTSTQFTVTHANNANNSAVITVHATSGPYADFTFTVQKQSGP